MEPELAIALPAVGAVLTAILHPRPRAALMAGALVGADGIGAVFLVAPGLTSNLLGVSLAISAMSRALLLVAAASLALIIAFPPPRADRALLLAWGLAGIASMAAIAAAPSLDLVILLVLAIAIIHAGLGGRRPLAARLRAPVLAVALLGAGLVFARLDGSPILALAVITRTRELMPTAGAVFAAILIGLGLLNVLWGGLASWLTDKGVSAWHYSFMADWGLVLCAFGILVADGQAAAVLLLFGIVLSRLPLYLWSRQSLRESIQTDRPINLLAAAMLAGAAPFAGFAARLFLLRGATQLYWPLALVIGIGLLLWLPPSLRLGRSLGTPRGRLALGVAIALSLSVAIGLYPQPILSLAGL